MHIYINGYETYTRTIKRGCKELFNGYCLRFCDQCSDDNRSGAHIQPARVREGFCSTFSSSDLTKIKRHCIRFLLKKLL